MAVPKRGKNGSIVRSVDKAVSVLHTLTQAERDIDLATLAEQTEIPKSTLVRLLRTLRLHNIVQQDGVSRRYRLGWGLIHLGKAAERQLDLGRTVRPYLDQLSKETGETASLAVLEGGLAVYLVQSPSNSIIRGVPPIGAQLELHCTAVGKVLLMNFTDAEFDLHIVRHGLSRATENTIVNSEQLRRDIALVREHGFAVDNEEAEMGGRCIAAPISGDDSNVVAAVSITGPVSRITFERVEEYAEIVKRAAQRISAALRVQRAES